MRVWSPVSYRQDVPGRCADPSAICSLMLSSNAIIDLSCEHIATRSYEYMLQRTDFRTDTRCTAFWVLRVCCTTNIGLCTMCINQHYYMLLSTDYMRIFCRPAAPSWVTSCSSSEISAPLNGGVIVDTCQLTSNKIYL